MEQVKNVDAELVEATEPAPMRPLSDKEILAVAGGPEIQNDPEPH